MNYKFELSDQMTITLGRVLGTGSYEVVAPIIEELQKQIVEQESKVSSSENKKIISK